ncbi:MAG: hypothetical protein AVDCRST_MAG05-1814, partial [uncultured Rubrobacteraceae bacterium]
ERNPGKHGESPRQLAWKIPDTGGRAARRGPPGGLLRDRLRPRPGQDGRRGLAQGQRHRPPQLRRHRPARRGPRLVPRRLRPPRASRRGL